MDLAALPDGLRCGRRPDPHWEDIRMVIRHAGFEINRRNRTIRIGDRVRLFTHNGNHSSFHEGNYFFKAVCHLILNGWTSKEQLFNYIFGEDESGGPNSGMKTLDVQINQWQPKLNAVGVHIVRDKRGGVIWYKIQEIPVNG